MKCAIFPGLAHKRLIRALQKYLHCKGLPLNTSQGLINALFKSCAPITNWLESRASSITQKRPLQIKIHMIYTWKALKGISSLLISHKCFKHPNFCSWFRKKGEIEGLSEFCVCVGEWVSGWVSWGNSLKFEICTKDRDTHVSPAGNQYQWGRNIAWSKFIGGIFYSTNMWNDSTFALNSSCIKTIVAIGRQSCLAIECNRSINILIKY